MLLDNKKKWTTDNHKNMDLKIINAERSQKIKEHI